MSSNNIISRYKLDVTDTATAFKHLTDAGLAKAYFLFRLLSFPLLAKSLGWLGGAAFRMKVPFSGLIFKSTVFKHFCGGESIDECLHTVGSMHKENVRSILDFAVEGKAEEKDYERVYQEIRKTIAVAKVNPAISFCVFKPTALCDIEVLTKIDAKTKLSANEKNVWESFQRRVESLCEEAFSNNVRIFIDAEETWIQNAIDEITTRMMQKYNKEKAVVFNTIQFYRKDRLQFLKDSRQHAQDNDYFLGIKMVRGAYLEKERLRALEFGYPSPVFDTKEETDKCFDEGLKYCVENIERIAICAGTHNDHSVEYLAQLIEEQQIDRNDQRIEFSQLYGMSDHLTYNLASNGFSVSKYVPYGPMEEVLPYLLRRVEENSAIAGQTTREFNMIAKERQRRLQET